MTMNPSVRATYTLTGHTRTRLHLDADPALPGHLIIRFLTPESEIKLTVSGEDAEILTQRLNTLLAEQLPTGVTPMGVTA
jgi:hypothetical protein